ncbi:tail fiber domain-containing protein [Flagellimonas onchidii]|uniref:tail fiber domain-containing protein n=1 Tax=Flagellimonas onchidii TaxID=2562684 RepID=UPI0010A66EB0|nr:tail fiber domain-containing protein [Allomuricauda onchidii]
MKRNNTTLKTYFETGDYPTEVQFSDLIDSFLNIEEEDAVTGITDNGNGTYTFQLLSGGTQVLDVKSLPDSIPIATIVGLQALLDGKVSKSGDTINGNLTVSSGTSGDAVLTVQADTDNNNEGDHPSIRLKQDGDLLDWRIGIGSNDTDTGGASNELVFAKMAGSASGIFFSPDAGATTHKMYHAGNDGAGSGLDADTLDGIQGSNFLRSDTDDTMSGVLTVGSRIKTNRIDTNSGQQLVLNAGESAGQATGQTGEYVYVNAEEGLQINCSPDNWSSGWGGRVTHNFGRTLSTINSDLTVNGAFRPNGGVLTNSTSENFIRQLANSGYLVGSHNTSSSGTHTNPIFTIGTSYLPNRATLGNMYGIGYSNSGASFLNSTDLGTNPGGWGMYVAADGNARIFLNASHGHIYARGNMYADNFILSSDQRKKTKIEDLNQPRICTKWKTFEMKAAPGELRYGVIAQDLQDNHPEFVYDDEDGNLSVRYIDLLVAKVAELESRLANVENK